MDNADKRRRLSDVDTDIILSAILTSRIYAPPRFA